MLVDIFIPCFIDQFKPETAFNMIKVLEHLGCKVNYNEEQTCCGHAAFNAGFVEEAREVAQKTILEFPRDHYVISPSASCVGMVRNSYGQMFLNSSIHNKCRQLQKNLYEFTEFIVNVLKKENELNATFAHKVAYMDTCSALRECNISSSPRKCLERVNGIQLLEIKDQETCCGFGGIFSVKNEPVSVAMADQKIKRVLDTGAEYITSTDYSCLMHLEGYIKKHNIPLKVIHVADILAAGNFQ